MKRRLYFIKDSYTKILFILPAILIFGVLLLYPVLSSIILSFTNKNLIKPDYQIIGFENYIKVLSDSSFWNSFGISIKWTIFSLLGQIIVGFIAALALNRVRSGQGLYRTLLIIPWAFPTIVIALAWKWILNGVYGFLPNFLVSLGICQSDPRFLTSPDLVFPSLLFINIWFGSPFIMVNVLSALKTIPAEQYEAAQIDGANVWQSFQFITLPHIRIVVGLLVVLRTIWVFNNFDMVYLLTGGGPAGMTTTVPIYAYNLGWGMKQMGRSSAVTILLLIFQLCICAIYFRMLNKWEKENK